MWYKSLVCIAMLVPWLSAVKVLPLLKLYLQLIFEAEFTMRLHLLGIFKKG